jgi:hypothetical protein
MCDPQKSVPCIHSLTTSILRKCHNVILQFPAQSSECPCHKKFPTKIPQAFLVSHSAATPFWQHRVICRNRERLTTSCPSQQSLNPQVRTGYQHCALCFKALFFPQGRKQQTEEIQEFRKPGKEFMAWAATPRGQVCSPEDGRAHSSETLLYTCFSCNSTRRFNPDDQNRQLHRRENLKPHTELHRDAT